MKPVTMSQVKLTLKQASILNDLVVAWINGLGPITHDNAAQYVALQELADMLCRPIPKTP